MLSNKQRWMLVSGGTALAVAFITREALKYGWNAATGDDPPMNPADTETAWTEAVTWTVAASVVAGLSRLAARRAAATFLDGPVPDDRYDV